MKNFEFVLSLDERLELSLAVRSELQLFLRIVEKLDNEQDAAFYRDRISILESVYSKINSLDFVE